MSNRKLKLISETIGNLLVKQIAHELKNYSLYKSFANYFSVEGLARLEQYYNKRAEEELVHSEWIHEYLAEADYKFMYPAVEANTEKVTIYRDPFAQTVDREIQTTQMIYAIYEAAQAEKDYMTMSWLLEKLIKEQIEEENTSRMALTIIEEDSMDIFETSKQILNLLK